jgi:hypothetical protein
MSPGAARLRAPFLVTAVLELGAGLPCLLVPSVAATMLGLFPGADLAVVLRLFGAALLALAALAWFAARPQAAAFAREAGVLLAGYHSLAAMLLWGGVVGGPVSPYLAGAAAVTHLVLAGWIFAGLSSR